MQLLHKLHHIQRYYIDLLGTRKIHLFCKLKNFYIHSSGQMHDNTQSSLCAAMTVKAATEG